MHITTLDAPDEPLGTSEDADRVIGIQPVEIDGVAVFLCQPDGYTEALHSGVAKITDGCLYVDGAIVVWHVDAIDQAAPAIADVTAGENSTPNSELARAVSLTSDSATA